MANPAILDSVNVSAMLANYRRSIVAGITAYRSDDVAGVINKPVSKIPGIVTVTAIRAGYCVGIMLTSGTCCIVPSIMTQDAIVVDACMVEDRCSEYVGHVINVAEVTILTGWNVT